MTKQDRAVQRVAVSESEGPVDLIGSQKANISLDASDFEALQEMLSAPGKANDRLVELFKSNKLQTGSE
ncbi:MAG: hypothetical protein OXR62_12985 [Ahrensia sp.]|nr:hypothetical protein [Ahrensia sp.]